MKRWLLLSVVVIIVLAGVGYILFFYNNSKAFDTESKPVDNPFTQKEDETTIKIPLKTENTSVSIRDFSNDSDTEKIPQSDYELFFSTQQSFDVEFNPKTGYLLATIYETPYSEKRTELEKYLLAKLKVSEFDICELKPDIRVSDKDSKLYGLNIGLSFCPNSITL